jgi:hypothetical protein
MNVYRLCAFVFCFFLTISLRAQTADSSAVPAPADTSGSAARVMQLEGGSKTFIDPVQLQAFIRRDTSRQDSTVAAVPQQNTEIPEGHFLIKGTIKDQNTGEGVPFAQVYFAGTQTGSVTEMDGSFSMLLPGPPPGDSLSVRSVGYKNYSRRISKTTTLQTYDIELLRSEYMLKEVIITPKEDPAIALLKKIIKHKPDNNPDKFNNYSYELYNKLELDLVRLSKEQFEKIPLMKPFAFIFNNLDSMSEEKPFLPVYLTEVLSDYYFQRSPKKTKEFIKANQLKGIKNESVTQFLGGMYQNINVYNNFIPVFDKQFISPISSNGLFYYKYKIMDTQEAYGQNIYLVQFAPKRPAENCFVGDFWVADEAFAIQRMSMNVSKDANINLVNRVSLYQEFAPVNDSMWFNVKDKFVADFTVPYGGKRMPGFIGRKTTSYRNIVVNDSSVSRVVNDPKLKLDIIIAEDARQKADSFWGDNRHDSLNKNEKAIYAMIDSLNNMPIFVRTKNALAFLTKGTKDVGPFTFGPYWYLYNSNPIEGSRFRFSMGTNPKLFKDLYLNGYLAYGTQDVTFKYKVSGLWLLNRSPRQYLYASYASDVDRSINYYSEVATDNILSSLVRKQYLPFKLAFVKDTRLEYFKEYYNGFSHEISLIHKDFNPYLPLPSAGIFHDDHGNPSDNVVNTEIGIKVRYAYKERFLSGNYYRYSLGSKYPIVSLRYAIGLKYIFNSAYEYQKLTINVTDNVKLPHFGTVSYNLFAGKHFGTLPYPLLEIHPGNDYYYYNKFAFSMMNRFEFISDEYAGLMLEHNIGGGVFNYIPLLKKAKLRQFWTLKTAVGRLSPANSLLNLNKGFAFNTLRGSPYVEIGTGVDNIFQLFRIDFVWRVMPTALPGESKEKYFGIFGSFHVGF